MSFATQGKAALCAAILALGSSWACAYSVDDTGNIRDSANKVVKLSGVNWFGFETDIYVAHGMWSRNWKSMVDQMKSTGFNAVRLPFCPKTLTNVAPPSGINTSLNADLNGLKSLDIMDKVIKYMSDQGMYILLDHHRIDCANNTLPELWYSSTYSETTWINDLKFVANRYKTVPGVIGIDLKNEPHGSATWGNTHSATDWNKAAERAGSAVLGVAPDLLMFVEGVGGQSDCSDSNGYFWGENITPIKCYPIDTAKIPRNRLVLAPHVYGPDVSSQSYFNASNFPSNMPAVWDAQVGFARGLNYAMAIGEFGGKYVSGSKDRKWQDAFVSYMIDKNMTNFFYWSWNPNSGDTNGILKSDWTTVDADKVTLLTRLFNANKGSGSSSSAASSRASSRASSSAASSRASSSAASSRASSSAASSRATSSAASSRASSSAASTTCQSFAGDKIEVDFSRNSCIEYSAGMTGKTLQVWDSDVQTCNFRGTVTSVDGTGSLVVDSDYERVDAAFTGKKLSFTSNNGCKYALVRVF